jgi:hypothetical protein
MSLDDGASALTLSVRIWSVHQEMEDLSKLYGDIHWENWWFGPAKI